MLNRFALTILATAVLASAIPISPLMAQIRGTGSGAMGMGITSTPAPSGTAGFAGGGLRGSGVAGGPTHWHRGHSSGRHSMLLPYPYFYSDYANDTEEAPPPQLVVVPAAPAPQPPALPLEPLLIEWQGDHFVRMTLSQKTSDGAPLEYSKKSGLRQSAAVAFAPGSLEPARPAHGSSPLAPRAAAQPARSLPPAVLVFRDGRRQEVSSYTIMSGIIYSNADYWTTGSWTNKIQIADLDVPATLKLNHEHGLNFVLPAGPNEVVTRP